MAIDSAKTAKRMGSENVYILYRRNKELMPASEEELNQALNDGVKIIFQTKVISAEVQNSKIQNIECIKTKIEDQKAVDIENSNYKMEANTIVFAIGAKANDNLLSNQGIETEYGLCKVDDKYMTNIKGVYAGGDLTQTKSSVARAVAAGKKAAEAILEEGNE